MPAACLQTIRMCDMHSVHAVTWRTSRRYSLFSSRTVLKYSSSFRSLMLHVPCVLYSCCQNLSLLPAQQGQL